tara:strand:+ start:134 stop:757 length:624 start_codon:yes stop_codon:yes gene_type:complete
MDQLHDLRLRLLVQQESQRISESQANELDLSVVQARCLCWLTLLAEASEEQANEFKRLGDIDQAMGWFSDSMRLQDVIEIVTSIQMPYQELDGTDLALNTHSEVDTSSLETEFHRFSSRIKKSPKDEETKDRADFLIDEYLKLLRREHKRETNLKLQLALRLEGKAMAIVDALRKEAKNQKSSKNEGFKFTNNASVDNFSDQSPLAA